MIIGLCGTSLPGRAEVAKLLIDRDFSYFSVQNEIADDMGKPAGPEEKLAWDLKACKREGNAAWVKRIAQKLKSEHAVIDGIRHEEEVAFLKKQGKFFLIGIYAPAEVKFKRAIAKDVMEKREAGTVAAEDEDALSEFSVLKHIDLSIPYPAKNIEAEIEGVLKKGKKG